MGSADLDELDRQILHLLQVDARRKTDTEIATQTGVTSTTVNNRIRRLEQQGVIRGYHPNIDYEAAGYPLVVLFLCEAPVAKRGEIAAEVTKVGGVVNVREVLSGGTNLHVKTVVESTTDVERVGNELDELGLHIVNSNIVSNEEIQPWNHFHAAAFENEPPVAAGPNEDGETSDY
jgi:DNA-binding Lrp family transcriptional regulator